MCPRCRDRSSPIMCIVVIPSTVHVRFRHCVAGTVTVAVDSLVRHDVRYACRVMLWNGNLHSDSRQSGTVPSACDTGVCPCVCLPQRPDASVVDSQVTGLPEPIAVAIVVPRSATAAFEAAVGVVAGQPGWTVASDWPSFKTRQLVAVASATNRVLPAGAEQVSFVPLSPGTFVRLGEGCHPHFVMNLQVRAATRYATAYNASTCHATCRLSCRV